MKVRREMVFLLAILICFGGVTSLREVTLLVEPTVVIRGGTAALICARDMQGAPLYSVKWYRGNHEFYRFTPMEDPDTRVFGLPGIYVDMNRSNGSQVLLRRMDLSLSGDYSCEVTADSPYFSTQIAHKFIDVIVLPPIDPVLKADKDRYQPGEILRANCTSSPARPAPNLTIYINDEPLRSSETSLHPSDSGLLWSKVNVELKVTPALFLGGRLRVACEAAVYNVYRRTASLDFFTPETDPRPERTRIDRVKPALYFEYKTVPETLPVVLKPVMNLIRSYMRLYPRKYNSLHEKHKSLLIKVTLNGDATKVLQNWFLLVLLIFLPTFIAQELIFEESFQFQADSHSDLARSLVGG